MYIMRTALIILLLAPSYVQTHIDITNTLCLQTIATLTQELENVRKELQESQAKIIELQNLVDQQARTIRALRPKEPPVIDHHRIIRR